MSRLFTPKLLFAAAFASLLIVSSTQTAFAVIELFYDDGEADSFGQMWVVGGYYAVKFSLPSGWSKARLVKARFHKMTQTTEVKVHIFASDGVTELTTPFNHDMVYLGWCEVDLTSRSIIVTGDFYVAFEWLEAGWPMIGLDQDTAWSGRSYWKDNIADSWKQQGSPTNYMIRAVVDQVSVGGYIIPVNTLAVLAPYLAAIGLVTVAAVALKKRRN